MPSPKKAPERRQRGSRTKDVGHLSASGLSRDEIPDPPKHLLKRTRDKWFEYWGSSVAQAVDAESDMPAVERLFQLYDERLRAYEAYRKNRLVKGSQGQPVLNPLASMMQKCDAEIRALEDRLGMNPKARLQLGITMTEAQKSLDELNRSLEPDWDDDEGEEQEAKLEAV